MHLENSDTCKNNEAVMEANSLYLFCNNTNTFLPSVKSPNRLITSLTTKWLQLYHMNQYQNQIVTFSLQLTNVAGEIYSTMLLIISFNFSFHESIEIRNVALCTTNLINVVRFELSWKIVSAYHQNEKICIASMPLLIWLL